jgi:hypothetical protein
VPYRKKLNFTWDALTGAASAVDRIQSAVARLDDAAKEGGSKPGAFPAAERTRTFSTEFSAALDDDLNTAEALGVLFTFLRDVNAAQVEGSLDAPDSRRGCRPRDPPAEGRSPACGDRGPDRRSPRGPQAPRLRGGGSDPGGAGREGNPSRGRSDRHEVEAGVASSPPVRPAAPGFQEMPGHRGVDARDPAFRGASPPVPTPAPRPPALTAAPSALRLLRR